MVGHVLFFVGLVGLVGFLGFLMWERHAGVRIFKTVREKCDRAASQVYRTLVFGDIPRTYRISFIARVRKGIHALLRVLISLLRAIEKPLARMSRSLRHTPDVRASEHRPSPFLQTMSEDKKKNGEKNENQV